MVMPKSFGNLFGHSLWHQVIWSKHGLDQKQLELIWQLKLPIIVHGNLSPNFIYYFCACLKVHNGSPVKSLEDRWVGDSSFRLAFPNL